MSSPKAVLSIQSEVVTGHVGNAAARLAMQRLGLEVWGVPTVILSSHAGHKGFAGEATSTALLHKLLDALETQGRLAETGGVLSGYLGSAEQAPLVAAAVTRTKAHNKTALYCLDPAFGDDGRIYARPGVAEAMRDTLLPLADIVRCNAFELAILTGRTIATPEDAAAAARTLGRPIVVATSIPVGDRLGTVLVADDDAVLATTPKIENPPHGAGDLFAALLFGHMVNERDLEEALERALLTTHHILSVSAGAAEMALVAEQEAIANPPALVGLEIGPIDTRSRAHG